MEKSPGFSGASIQPSVPPPTAPPPYEEVVAAGMGATPYPVGPASMPMPTPYNQPGNQPPMPMPMPPNYSGYSLPTTQSQTQQPNAPEVQIIHQHVTYALSSTPVKMTCPTCHVDIKTTTISDHQPSAHMCCIALCLLGCCLCSCLPYCMSAFTNVHHFCPNCKNYIGTWKG